MIHAHQPGRRRTSEAEQAIAHPEIVADYETGKPFRASVEDTFRKAQQMTSTWRVEILTPESGHFLIGDNPGVAIRQERPGAWAYGMAIGDATFMVLLIGPRHLLALGPNNLTGAVPAAAAEALTTVQVLAAKRYAYMHPHSNLQPFVAKAAQQRSARRQKSGAVPVASHPSPRGVWWARR